MLLTQKLLGFLNRVFDKDPKAFTALRIQYAGGGMSWRVQDQVLSTTVDGGAGQNLEINLGDHTIRSLVDYIAGQTGYSVTYIDNDRAQLAATVLLDSTGDQSSSNGDRLDGYTSLLWAWMEAAAIQLAGLKVQVQNMMLQLSVDTGEGIWLDEIGGYYNVKRLDGELDQFYGPRIIAETLRPRSNNIAIENAIETYTGQQAEVVDVVIYGGDFPLYDNTIDYDAAHNHSAGANPLYGLFDVYYAYDLMGGGPIETFQATIEGIIERMRAAGTHMRALALTRSMTYDQLVEPTDELVAGVSLPMADTLTEPADALSPIATATVIAETFSRPSDNSDRLYVAADYIYNADHLHGGLITYGGGLIVEQSIDGLTVYGTSPIGVLGSILTDAFEPILTDTGAELQFND